MLSNVNLPDISNSNTEEKNLTSIFSPTGNYLSPASLDGRTPSITSGNSNSNTGNTNNSTNNNNNDKDHSYSTNNKLIRNQNPISLPSPLSFLNGSLNQLGLQRNMTSSPSTILSKASSVSTPNSNIDINNSSNELHTIKTDESIKPDTSVSSTVKDKKGHVVKRKYSRNGCTECKKRRMKCDETKPTCWQCARLNRDCVYISNPRNKKRKTQNGDKDISTDNKSEAHTHSSTQSPVGLVESQPENGLNSISNNGSPSLLQNITGNNSPNFSTNQNTTNTNNGSNFNNITSEVSNTMPMAGMDGIDTNLLMQNLNDIVNMKPVSYTHLTLPTN